MSQARMANYLPIYLFIVLIPFDFLAAACYSTHPVYTKPTKTPMVTLLKSIIWRLSDLHIFSYYSRRKQCATGTLDSPTADLEMQRIFLSHAHLTHPNKDMHSSKSCKRVDSSGSEGPSNDQSLLPRSPPWRRRAASSIMDSIQQNHAAPLTSLQRPRGSREIVQEAYSSLPPRPSAPSPPSSTASMPGKIYQRHQGEDWWKEDEEEVTAPNLGAEGIMPAFRRTLTAALGRNSVGHSNSRGDGEWTVVTLLP